MTNHYVYDAQLSESENRKRALALHEKDGPCVADPQSGIFYFPDGATMENFTGAMPTDPSPEDRRTAYAFSRWEQTMLNRKHYWMIRGGKAERAFHELKRKLERQGWIEDDEIEKLREHQREILLARDHIELVEQEQNPPAPPICVYSEEQLAEIRKRDAERHERQRRNREAVESLEI